MFCRTCESPAAVHNKILNGQPNRSAMARHNSGGTAYVITASSVPGKYQVCLIMLAIIGTGPVCANKI